MPWSAVTKTMSILLLLSPPLLREPLFLRVLLTFNIYSFAEAALRGVGCFYLIFKNRTTSYFKFATVKEELARASGCLL